MFVAQEFKARSAYMQGGLGGGVVYISLQCSGDPPPPRPTSITLGAGCGGKAMTLKRKDGDNFNQTHKVSPRGRSPESKSLSQRPLERSNNSQISQQELVNNMSLT